MVKHLKIINSVTAVGCLVSLAGPVASEEDYIYVATLNYADMLSSADNEIRQVMQTWDGTGNGQATLDHLKTKDTIPYDAFPQIGSLKISDWDIRARLCDNYLIVYYMDNSFKFNIKPTQVRMAQKMRLDKRGFKQRAASMHPLGFINQTTIVDQSGLQHPLPSCFDTNYATPLPRGVVAIGGFATANGLYSNTRQEIEYRKSPCTKPKVGIGLREKRTKFVPVDGYGLPTKVAATYSAWTTANDYCAAPKEYNRVAPNIECTFTPNSVSPPQKGSAVYEYRMKQFQSPADPYKTVELAVDFITGEVTSAPRGNLLFNFCDKTPPPQKVTSSQVKTEEVRTRSCSEIYPVPPFSPIIDYDRGSYIENRAKIVLTQAYDWNKPSTVITSYSEWKVKADTCHRYLFETSKITKSTKTCPDTGDIGLQNYTQQIDYYKMDYAWRKIERSFAESGQVTVTKKEKLASNDCYYTTATNENSTDTTVSCGKDNGTATVTSYDIVTRTIWRDGRPTTSKTQTVSTGGCPVSTASSGGSTGGSVGVGDAGNANGRNGSEGGGTSVN